jgi:hypothetical protein
MEKGIPRPIIPGYLLFLPRQSCSTLKALVREDGIVPLAVASEMTDHLSIGTLANEGSDPRS